MLPKLIIQEKHRLLAYRIDRGRKFPPENSPAEVWVKTGKGENYKWDNLATHLARFEYVLLFNISNWDEVIINFDLIKE